MLVTHSQHPSHMHLSRLLPQPIHGYLGELPVSPFVLFLMALCLFLSVRHDAARIDYMVFLCLARCASNCLAKLFKFFDVRRSIFGGYLIRWLNKGKTLLLITNLMKLGFLLPILIAYCCRNRGRGLIC